MVNAFADTTSRTYKAHSGLSPRRQELARVISQIEDLCEAFGIGARIPAYRDLMSRFDTSERTILAALAELQRTGRIVRRAGSGTYVAKTGKHQSRSSVVYPALPSLPTETSAIPYPAPTAMSVVVVASHDNSYLSRGIELIYDHAQALGCSVSYEPPRVDRIEQLCRLDDGVERGFLVLGSNRFELCQRIHATGRRVVFVGGAPDNAQVPFPSVDVDGFHGAYDATRHLIDLGHRRLAIVEPISVPRHLGHETAVRDAQATGLDITLSKVSERDLATWRTHPAAVTEFFAKPDHPTGLCVWNDHDCIKLLTMLQSAHIRVPQQVSLVGYDDGVEARNVTPALTTVNTRLDDRIQIALNLLLNQSPGTPAYTAVVKPSLVVRSSTARHGALTEATK